MPYNVDTALVAILVHLGADVVRPRGVDADDAIATLAVHLDAGVLSRDSDFLRYPELPHDRLFETFDVRKGRIFLARRKSFTLSAKKEHLPPRALLPRPLDLGNWRRAAPASKLLTNESDTGPGRYLRGDADGLTRRLGNLHAVAAPVCHAVFARMGITQVYEQYPIWNSEAESAGWFSATIDTGANTYTVATSTRPPSCAGFAITTQPRRPAAAPRPGATTRGS